MQQKHKVAMLAAIVHIVNGDWAALVQDLAEMDVVPPTANTQRFTMVCLLLKILIISNLPVLQV